MIWALKHCLRDTLKINDYIYNIYLYFCHIRLIVIIDRCIGEQFFCYFSICYMWQLIFIQVMIALKMILLPKDARFVDVHQLRSTIKYLTGKSFNLHRCKNKEALHLSITLSQYISSFINPIVELNNYYILKMHAKN